MGIFGRGPRQVIANGTIAGLAVYGKAVIESKRSASGTPAGFGWDYIAPVASAMHGPQSDQAIQELYDAARSAAERPMAAVGAYALLYEAGAPERDQRFLELRDSYLDLLHEMGFSSGHLTRHEADRWIELHGDLRSSFDRITDVPPPPRGQEPSAKDLERGQSRLIARARIEFYAERRADGKYACYSLRQKTSDDPTIVKCDERIVCESMQDLLRAVGMRFFGMVIPEWADEDLWPYISGRRS